MGCSEEIDRTPSGNRTESETRSRDFPWVPSTTNDPAAVPRDTPSAALDHATLAWMFWDRGQTPVVLFLWSKVIGNVPFIEKNDGRLDRTEDRERGIVSPYLSNGKYSSPRVVNERIRETNRQIVDDNSFLF